MEGFRDAKKALVEMSEKAASVDERKSATLEQMSDMVDSISRELPAKKEKLAPLIAELKGVRQQYMEVMADFGDKKATFDKVAVGLDLEKQSLESDSDAAQEECLREESRYHYLNCLMTIAKNKLERANQEKKWQTGSGRMMRDFASYKELYSQKLTQQDQLSKQLRRQQKELKENAGVMTNQKTNFRNLKMLLDAKIQTSGQTN